MKSQYGRDRPSSSVQPPKPTYTSSLDSTGRPRASTVTLSARLDPLTNVSQHSISKRTGLSRWLPLNGLAVPTARGGTWHAGTVRNYHKRLQNTQVAQCASRVIREDPAVWKCNVKPIYTGPTFDFKMHSFYNLCCLTTPNYVKSRQKTDT